MRNKVISTILIILFSHFAANAQEGPHNAISFNGVYAGVGYYGYVEYERFLSDNSSVAARIGFVGYSYADSEYEEDGSGPGFGAAYRWYFGKKPMGGFFVGAGLEFVSTSWEYWDYYDGYGSGTSFSVAPTGQIGGRFNIGSSFFIAPSLITGYFVAVSGSESELGLFGGPDLTLGFRF